jgi:hypothetical protein
MFKTKVYQQLSSIVAAYHLCVQSDNTEWAEKHLERIEAICKKHLPHGSGFDVGVSLDIEASSKNHLVLEVPYHPMNQWGMYISWTTTIVTVEPDLTTGFVLGFETQEPPPQWDEWDVENHHDYINDVLGLDLENTITVGKDN